MRRMSLAEVKNTEFEILKFIDKICKSNDIAYSVDGGTLLGAVRHKGFIPWDDDIDVIMVRDQYEKFIKIISGISSRYKGLSCYNNKTCFYPFVKICDSRTALTEYGVLSIKNYGIYVDIFPIDAIPSTGLCSSIYLKSITFLKYLIGIRAGSSMPKNIFKRQIWKVFKAVFDIIPINKLGKILNEFSQVYNNVGTKYSGNNVWGADYCKVIPNEYFSRFIDLTFENYTVKGLAEYDFYLKVLYGDYMKLPPKEKQISNHNFVAYFKDI